jgi:alpha-L-arabinofuranosidase
MADDHEIPGAAVEIVLDLEHDRGTIDRRLFGSFVEHMGRCVYTGIYEPGHPTADHEGFRGDVAELIEELGITVIRYPGGNFVSGYRWEDGIGPCDLRPHRLDPAWRSIETNQVGTDEFLRWAARRRVEPMLAVNLGTRGIQAAADLVEYCNVPGGTQWSDLRRRNGSADPYGVKLWCLGNEMDGPWQIGHKTAAEYGALAAQAGQAMKLIDPDIELVACGSSHHRMPTFGYWESTSLEIAWDVVDYVSMHAYYEELDGDRRSFLASGFAMSEFIDDVAATIDAVAARKHSRARPRISFDEWNVWYQARFPGTENLEIDTSGPRIEDVYGTLDAVVVGDLLITLLNHADRVAVACLAQLVNVIAPIMTEPNGNAWRQAIFAPIAAVAKAARGVGLVARIRTPEVETNQYGDVPAVAAAATYDAPERTLSIFVTNRAEHPVDAVISMRGEITWTTIQSTSVIIADDKGPLDTAAARHVRQRLPGTRLEGSTITLTLPAESWSAVIVSAA